jgi:nucleoside phosphorylase
LQPSEDVILTFAVARRSGSETLKKTFSYLRKAKQNRKAVSSGLLVCLDEILYELSSRVNSDSNRSDLGEKSGPGVTMPERIHGGQSRSGPFILVRAVTNERSITNHRNRTMRVLVFSALDDEISFLIEPKDGYQYKMNEKFQWVFDPRQDIHKSSLALKSGEVIEVFAATAHEAGLTQTAIRATECTRTIEPDLAIMIGICGGRRKAAETGDIVMPTRSFLYAFGALESGQIKPEIRDEIVGERVSAWAHNILGGQIEMLYKSFPKLEGRPRSVPRFIKAPIACGDLVIKDENVLEEIASQKDRKVCGVDMESYAFIRAARQQLSSTEKVVVIKSVSDYSDKSKGDSYHDYCMYITSACAVALVEAVATMPHLV